MANLYIVLGLLVLGFVFGQINERRHYASISVDYFKRILTSLRNFFGGNMRSYETLVDRARREAILRLKESCPDAQQIINLRLETSSIYKGQGNQIGSVEVLAYGTAIYT